MCTIGILGFGVVGKSIFSFLNEHKHQPEMLARGKLRDVIIGNGQLHLVVWDKRELTRDEKIMIEQAGGRVVAGLQTSLDAFIDGCNVVIASPGIAIEPYKNTNKPILCELDLFSLFFTKPVIAITGSLGKTTTTKLLGTLTERVGYHAVEQQSEALGTDVLACDIGGQAHVRTAVGGNIGIGMMDLVKQSDDYDLGVLELSSFQLDLNTTFAPDIAVWTNFYPNHLDRHVTQEAYFQAKCALIAPQRKGQLAILSDGLLKGATGHMLAERLPDLASDVCFTSANDLDSEIITQVDRKVFYWMYVHDNHLWCAQIVDHKVVAQTHVFDVAKLPDITFTENWIQVLTALYFLRADMASLATVLLSDVDLLDDHHHRVEYFATVGGVDFYEDSKSTVIQATQAAVGRLAQQQRPLIVIVGGMSKGVDRRPLMAYLKSVHNIKKVYCFGSECSAFADAVHCTTLEDIVHDIKATMVAGDIVLFSPSGASFDFFDNYKHRGQVFKELVLSKN